VFQIDIGWILLQGPPIKKYIKPSSIWGEIAKNERIQRRVKVEKKKKERFNQKDKSSQINGYRSFKLA
jgi:hypothetical protein